MTSTDLLETEQLPRRLVVLGGGSVGVEFAAMYANYGSDVTVIERNPSILGNEDDDVAECAREILARAGVTVLTSADVTGISDDILSPHRAPPHAVVSASQVTLSKRRFQCAPINEFGSLPESGDQVRP